MIKEKFVFLKQFIHHFQDTGAICSTSRWAAEAMTNPLRGDRKPQRILELGPGTGSVTVQILEDMIDGDELTICEINPSFMALLKERLATNENFLRHRERVTFHTCAAQELPEPKEGFTVIVCSLPFLNFPLSLVQEIFEKLQSVCTSDAVMTYYQYMGLCSLGKVVAPAKRKKQLRDLDNFFDHVHETHDSARRRVWLNLLPINIYTLKVAVA